MIETRWQWTIITAVLLIETLALSGGVSTSAEAARPNILLAISDDQSFPHASAYGYKAIRTPSFDRVAREGVLFTNAFVASPGCSPSRASILTGRYPWQNEHAGTHASSFSNKYAVYTDLLEASGYWVGYTGKGWGPGNFRDGGFARNPAGNLFAGQQHQAPAGISGTDYAAGFKSFLEQRPDGQPFCFWYGGHEPHRAFGKGLGQENGGSLGDVAVPSFLPDDPEVRSDLLDYCFEIQWFDRQLGAMLDVLEQAGELDNTIVVVTSDNGMAFPRAKANAYEYGIHVPLAIRWGNRVSANRRVNDLVSLVDLAPTFLEATGVAHPDTLPMSGRSLMNILNSAAEGTVDPTRTAVYSARERHSSSRWNNLGYPQRCMRTRQFLYVRNFRPERWPAGAPRKMGTGNYAEDDSRLGPSHGGYHDIDASPTLSFLIRHADDSRLGRFLSRAVERRPAEELFDILDDPSCLNNLAQQIEYDSVKTNLAALLDQHLRQTGDPRVLDGGDVFESYRRYSRLRKFPRPKWAESE